jgi:hypothetical protein
MTTKATLQEQAVISSSEGHAIVEGSIVEGITVGNNTLSQGYIHLIIRKGGW